MRLAVQTTAANYQQLSEHLDALSELNFWYQQCWWSMQSYSSYKQL